MSNPFIESPVLWISLTLGIFILAAALHKKWSIPVFNPLLFTIFIMILLLVTAQIPYETYQSGGKLIGIFVTPATVSLAIKLEKNFIYLKKYYPAILTGIFGGIILHTLMIFIFGFLFHYNTEMIGTLFPKSITTAIAVGVSESLGGVVSLTVAVVVFTGIVGGVIGPSILKFAKIDNPVAQGVALGSSAHAMGTAKAIEMGEVQGAMAGLSIVITGIVVVILTPFVEPLIQLFFV